MERARITVPFFYLLREKPESWTFYPERVESFAFASVTTVISPWADGGRPIV
jgi:hypothetical protein